MLFKTKADMTGADDQQGASVGYDFDAVLPMSRLRMSAPVGPGAVVQDEARALRVSQINADLPTAQALMQRMRRERLGPSTEAYNAMLGVISAVGGMGEDALALHDQMLRDAVRPDAITYVEMLSACKPTNLWESTQESSHQKCFSKRCQGSWTSSRYLSHG